VFLCCSGKGSDFYWMGGGWKCLNKNRSRHGKGGIIAHYCAMPPSQPSFLAYNIAQYIFPTTPFIAIKYWQYLVRAKVFRFRFRVRVIVYFYAYVYV